MRNLRINRRTMIAGSLATVALPVAMGDSRLTFDAPQTQRWRIGLVLNPPVTCTNVYATFPVPIDWPEQKVTVESQTVDPQVNGWEIRNTARERRRSFCRWLSSRPARPSK